MRRDDPGPDGVAGEALDDLLVGHAAGEFAMFGDRVENHERPDGGHQHVLGELHLDVEQTASVVRHGGKQLSWELVVAEIGLGRTRRLRFGRAPLFLAPLVGGLTSIGLTAVSRFRTRADERPQPFLQRSGIESFLAVVLDPVDRFGQGVEAGEHGVDGVVRERAAALAEELEDLLHLMGELGDRGEAHRRAHALERVRDPEDLIDRRAVLRVLLKARRPRC